MAMAMAAGGSMATAQDNGHTSHGTHDAHASHAGHEAAAPADLVDGEVRKIDKEAGKITMRHGEIKNLNMAAMTMVLRVQDPAMLDQVNVGDKVRFAADRMNGAVTITKMDKAQ
jgi:Cu/Ag efflux protein CusF